MNSLYNFYLDSRIQKYWNLIYTVPFNNYQFLSTKNVTKYTSMEACKCEAVIVISKFKDGIFISSYPFLRSTCRFDNCIVHLLKFLHHQFCIKHESDQTNLNTETKLYCSHEKMFSCDKHACIKQGFGIFVH